MSKYIDKEVLLERMNRTSPYEGADGTFERHRRLQWLADMGQINMCPTADVVEIVRCKDCKHADLFYPYCTIWEAAIDGDGYCYKGENE